MAWVNVCDIIYPVGYIYKTEDPVSPSELFGGSWQLLKQDYDLIHVGSQVIYPGTSGSGTKGWTSLIGSYGYSLIEGPFSWTTEKEGYEQAYRLSTSFFTRNANYLTLAINNIQTRQGGTWSGDSYRNILSTDIFKRSELVLEPTYSYTSTNGLNLKYQITGTSDPWQFWNVTIHCYLCSKKQRYEWIKIA